MKRALFVVALAAGCGGGAPASMTTPSGADPLLNGWVAPAPTAGETQILAPIVKGIQPGSDVTYCSYLDVNFPGDVDIISYIGSQSKGGHHAILYAARQSQAANTHLCTNDDMNNGSFLASTGSDTSAPSETIPAGVVFRLTKGTQLFIETHWINASTEVLDGGAAMNVLAVPSDPTKIVAAEFVAIKINGLLLPPQQTTTLSTDCVFGADMQLYMIGGHAHEYGTNVTLDKVVNGQVQNLYDKAWTSEFTFNTPFVSYGIQQPLKFAKGDVMRVTCTWNNTTTKTIGFPDEMCAGYGYYFPSTTGDLYCIDGAWPTN